MENRQCTLGLYDSGNGDEATSYQERNGICPRERRASTAKSCKISKQKTLQTAMDKHGMDDYTSYDDAVQNV